MLYIFGQSREDRKSWWSRTWHNGLLSALAFTKQIKMDSQVRKKDYKSKAQYHKDWSCWRSTTFPARWIQRIRQFVWVLIIFWELRLKRQECPGASMCNTVVGLEHFLRKNEVGRQTAWGMSCLSYRKPGWKSGPFQKSHRSSSRIVFFSFYNLSFCDSFFVTHSQPSRRRPMKLTEMENANPGFTETTPPCNQEQQCLQ